MDYEKKKTEIDEKFRELEAAKQKLVGQINEITTEQARLQGEYRLINKMSEEDKQTKK